MDAAGADADAADHGASATCSGGNATAAAASSSGDVQTSYTSRAELLRHLRRGGHLAATACSTSRTSAVPSGLPAVRRGGGRIGGDDSSALIRSPSSLGDANSLHDVANAVNRPGGAYAASATVHAASRQPRGSSSDAEPIGICPVPLCLPAGLDSSDRDSLSISSASALSRRRIRGKQRVTPQPLPLRPASAAAPSDVQWSAMAAGVNADPPCAQLCDAGWPAT